MIKDIYTAEISQDKCCICGATLHFEAYDRDNYAYKRKVKLGKKFKTLYYCGYNHFNQDSNFN